MKILFAFLIAASTYATIAPAEAGSMCYWSTYLGRQVWVCN
jgi:hypothetical protein